MTNLQMRQTKIQEKRKKTPFREFLMDIASRYPLNIYKNNSLTSAFPPTERCGNIANIKTYLNEYDNKLDNFEIGGNFIDIRKKLFHNHIKPSSIQFGENENSDYGHCIFRAKNVYLGFIVGESSESVCYSSIVYQNCTNIYNSIAITNNSNNIYSSKSITNSYNIFFSQYIQNSSDIRMSDNLIGCHNCINCSDLENCSYYINNQSVSKEHYEHYKKKTDMSGLINIKNSSKGLNRVSENSVGQGIIFSQDVQNGYSVIRLNKGKNVCYIEGVNGCEDFYDVFEAGINSSNFYGVCNGGTNTHHVYCSSLIDSGSSHIFYSYHLESCSFCLGCIGLKNKSYCILNKQYTKEERYTKVDEIFTQMEQDGQLGEFFPATMNPFYFNDTAAYLIDPSFTKEEVTAKGYLRRDEPIKVDIPEGMEIVTINELENYEGRITDTGSFISVQEIRNSKSEILPSYNRSINADILKKVIQDDQGNVYRVIPMEYKFLVKHGLPLPRKHWLERMKENFKIN